MVCTSLLFFIISNFIFSLIFENNNLIFEGKYYNDKKWDGKGYNKNKEIFELKNGKGKVNEYQYDLLLFEGDYQED